MHECFGIDANYTNLHIKLYFISFQYTLQWLGVIFRFQCSTRQTKQYSKILLINYGLQRLIPTQKHLNHSIMRSFIMWTLKVGKTKKMDFFNLILEIFK